MTSAKNTNDQSHQYEVTCPACLRKYTFLLSTPLGDASCPACGHAMRYFGFGALFRVAERSKFSADEWLEIETSLSNLNEVGSLDLAEVLNDLEDRFGDRLVP